ncbi:MAG: transposase family protein, partial [Deltaproteobacteria bacterium]|nr:transposase family protein [Deltaproteobacteria bacterium]
MSYKDPRAPGSFGGIGSVRRYGGKLNELSKTDAYTLHKAARVRFPRRKTYSKGTGDLFQIDLVDLTDISSHNDGYRYLLTCIDVFTKRAWAVPVKTKSGRDVTSAFEKILDDGTCNMLQSDKGTEFLNHTFQSMLRRRNVKFYTSENEDIKAAVVERFNRTLKTKMYRYFTAFNTKRYVDVLPDLLHSYNNTYHRSIGMTPTEVDAGNENLVRARLYPVKPKSHRWKYRVCDRVRITTRRRPFAKGYLGRWSREIFEIDSRLPTVPVSY